MHRPVENCDGFWFQRIDILAFLQVTISCKTHLDLRAEATTWIEMPNHKQAVLLCLQKRMIALS
jgi:hypothetical protein